MKYHMKSGFGEWTIEPLPGEVWVLKEKTAVDWCPVGTYRTPNEAAVIVGARRSEASDWRERHHARLKWVLSCWEAFEHN